MRNGRIPDGLRTAFQILAAIWCVDCPAALLAAETRIGLLMSRPAAETLETESGLARETAEKLLSATTLVPAPDAKFVDLWGRDVALDGLAAVWCHAGGAVPPPGPLFEPQTIEALRRYVSHGHGLLLSGEAVRLVGPLGLDTLQAAPVPTAQDGTQAGLRPLAATHPVFRNLDLDQGVLWLSNAAYPAFAEFRLRNELPQRAILARSPGGPDCPLVEYELGAGRVLVLGWRLDPLYGHAPAGLRGNFTSLLTNALRYLGDARAWLPLARSGGDRPPSGAAEAGVTSEQWRSLELAIRDLQETFGARYAQGAQFLDRLQKLQARHRQAGAGNPGSAGELAEISRLFQALRDEALLANPLLDFSQLLLVRRDAKKLGLPANYLGNCSLPPTGYENQIAVLSPVRPTGKRTTLYQPAQGAFVGDVRLDYDARRLMFSMPNSAGRWRVFELQSDGTGLRELPLINEPDVDNYDACYLPDGRIVFSSTACFAGIPCVNGEGHVANLYLRETTGKIRQLTVEQDHDWCPTVLNNGRILYLRWEYTDLPHAFSRILFHMNPDGTEQMEYYGSSSYWPAAMFYARPIPDHPTQVVAVVGGHHESPRMGSLVILDPARGRQEAEGAVQRIPGYGRKVEPVVLDLPIAYSWPKFLHPYPLSGKHFLVSCQPRPDALWGLYLVDVFDNAVLLHEEPGFALLEPLPLRPTPKPPCVADKVDLSRQDAEVLIADIYRGVGLQGVPRGAIKSLRVLSYHFAYEGMGAEPYAVGLDGPWDPKRILGTVPVLEDGSAHFRVPAYTPIALQPLDADGQAVQLMRSWFTAMPGEHVACVGCHEKQNTAPPARQPLAAQRPPTELAPWYGPPRGFAFRREVQPVLDRHCVRCHDGQPRSDGRVVCNLADGHPLPVRASPNRHNQGARFSPSYYQLRRFVRTPCKESDMHVLGPWEYHAETTRLIQLLRKGHYDVQLDAEAWSRLVTWIDLNAPFHGTWSDIRGDEIGPLLRQQAERRTLMRRLYTGQDDPAEDLLMRLGGQADVPPRAPTAAGASILSDAPNPAPLNLHPTPLLLASASAPRPGPDRRELGEGPTTTLALAPGVSLELVRVAAGQFWMGQADGCADERPAGLVTVDRPFWMGRCEVTNEQFALFDPAHDSRWENNDFIKFGPGELGFTVARPRQPVVRVSWLQALAFCRWLSQRTGQTFTLPTEAQWEYACRAGTSTPLWYGTVAADFSQVANVSDRAHYLMDQFGDPNRPEMVGPWRPADTRFDDFSRVSAPVGSYRANPWGLCDMHGNVAEWTRSEYRPYPYRDDGRNAGTGGKRVVRGGSWYDRPDRCRAAFRQVYLAEQPVYDVGFRVICETAANP